ncbi:hypothetical protein RQP46_007720 [Phenoliferia psychrophenolica]
MPPKAALTCFLAKFQRTTVFLPITSSSTLATLRVALLDALTQSRPTDSPELEPEPTELPNSAAQIAFWKSDAEDEEGGTQWVQLKDEKSGADKWGLGEAAVLGVSFKEDGVFPPPNVVAPPQDD